MSIRQLPRAFGQPKTYEEAPINLLRGTIAVAIALIAQARFKNTLVSLAAGTGGTLLLQQSAKRLFSYDWKRVPEQDGAHVVIVGAGPIGLFTALNIKERSPDAKIVILEKRDGYVRTQTVSLEKIASFWNVSRGGALAKVVKGFSKQIKIQEIEKRLKAAALSAGIEIRRQEVTEPENLPAQFPDAKVIIGADGSKSVVRRKIFKEMSHNQVLNRLMRVTYKVEKKAPALGFVQRKTTKGAMGRMASEHLGKDKKVSVTLFINDEEFNHMRETSTFKDPLDLSDERVDALCRERVSIWLKERETLGELRVEGSEEVTVFPLPVYSSKWFTAKPDPDGPVFALAGDAAFAVPYFRAMNDGFIAGGWLALATSQFLASNSEPLIEGHAHIGRAPRHFAHYAKKMWRLANGEIKVAQAKQKAIDAYDTSIRTVMSEKISGHKPLPK